MALPEKHKLPMYFGTDYKELYHDSKITLPQFPPTLCGTKSGFAPGMKSPASLKVINIEPQAWNWQKVQTCSWTDIPCVEKKKHSESANQDCLVRAAGSQLHDVIFGILRPFVKIIDEKKPFR